MTEFLDEVFGKHPFIQSQVFFSLISFDKSDTFKLTRNERYALTDRWEGGRGHLLGMKKWGSRVRSPSGNIMIRWVDV